MLRADLAVSHGVELIDVGGFPLRAPFNHPFTRIIILVRLHTPVVGDLLDAALFVPEDRAAGAV